MDLELDGLRVALGLGAVLLVSDVVGLPRHWHAALSALPLGAAGAVYGWRQLRAWRRRRPWPPIAVLLRRLLLAATFLTWAMVQLLPPGGPARLAGDAVIGAYVLDLYWVGREQRAAGLMTKN